MADLPELLTTKEAAEALRVSVTTIRRMLKRGDLTGFSRAGIGRVTVDSVRQLLNITPLSTLVELRGAVATMDGLDERFPPAETPDADRSE